MRQRNELIVFNNTTSSDAATSVRFLKLSDGHVLTALTFAIAGVSALVSFGQRSPGGALIALAFLCVGLMRTTHATNGFLFLCSLSAALAMGELSLQLMFQREALKIAPDSTYAKSSYWSNSDLGSQGYPGQHTSKKLTTDGEVVYDVAYSIGEDGFRNTPQSESNARFMINFFGCSLLFGEGLNDKETLPYYTHALDNSIRVKNFGWHGYGVHQALKIVEMTPDRNADINFLLTSPWHADRSACIPDYSNGSPRYRLLNDGSVTLDGNCGIVGNALGRMINRSNIYQLARFALGMSQDRQIDLYLAIIQRMYLLSQARNQRFIIGFIKAEDTWFHGTYSNQKILERLRGIGIEVIDLTLAASAASLSRDYYLHPLDRHPSAKANDARAKLIVNYLETTSRS